MTNREDIIAMAREAWYAAGEGWVIEQWFHDREAALTRFAALVAAAERKRFAWTHAHWTEYERNITAAAKAEEREACAQLCESLFDMDDDSCDEAEKCAAAIRARKEIK